MLLLRCPKCKQTMKYQGMSMTLFKKRKTCVYCGRSFAVKDSIVKKI